MSAQARLDVATSFFRHCQSAPERAALGFFDKTYTYGELMERVQCIYEVLESEPYASSPRIGVLATPDVNTYAAILAILASGRAYVPIHPQHPPQRSVECLQQAETSVLLQSGHTSKVHEWLSTQSVQVGVIDTTSLPEARRFRDPAPTTGEELAYILFTSGSTGTPKGVPIYRRNVEAFFGAFLSMPEFEFGKDDRFLQMFDLTFDLSIMSALTPLMLGASAFVPSGKNVGYFGVQRVLEKNSITVALMVPSVLGFLQRYFGEISLPQLRYSMFCGEALPESLVAQWRACVPNARIFNVYGPTEATIFCTSYEVPESGVLSHNGVISIGAPMPGSRLLALDDRLEPVKDGDPGDLFLSGPQVTTGYWRNSEKSREAFLTISEDGRQLPVYRTGDVAFARDGEFFYCGRSDQQVKIAGYRVELGEIEFHARQLHGALDAAAVAETDAAGKTVLHLFVQSAGQGDVAHTSKYLSQLADALPSYMVPQKIHSIQQFPLNQNGKIDRRQLLKLVKQDQTA